MTLSSEQIAERHNHLHASEWAFATGESCRWATTLDIYAHKLNLIEPPGETPLMRLGSLMQTPIRELYAPHVRPENVVIPNDQQILGPDGWWAGTPDAVVEDYSMVGLRDPFPVGGAEFKYCRDDREWGEPPDGPVPIEYDIQCRIYMALMDVDWWDLVPLFRDEDDVRVYHLLRDREREAELIEEGRHFWFDHVLAQVPPEAVPETAPRTIAAISGPETGEMVRGNGHQEELIWRYKKAVEKAGKADKAAQNLKTRIMTTIGAASGIEGPGYRITWHTNKNGSRGFRATWEDE